ncbi:hypothetical protein LJR254_002006 [Rhizobium sp. LjRoot254]
MGSFRFHGVKLCRVYFIGKGSSARNMLLPLVESGENISRSISNAGWRHTAIPVELRFDASSRYKSGADSG